MAEIQEQTQLASEIQDQISSPPINADLDEVRCSRGPSFDRGFSFTVLG